MAKIVDSWRFLDSVSRPLMKHWATLEGPRDIPWTPLTKPLRQCRVAVVTSAAVVLKTDSPFDPEIERRDPWFADPSYRAVPRTAKAEDVRVCHTHINASFGERDLNCVMPLERLNEIEALGEIGRSAPSHYSYFGYTMRPGALLRDSVPAILRRLREEQVDVVVLVPV